MDPRQGNELRQDSVEEYKQPVDEPKWIWGVTCASHAHIGVTKLRISIQDVHLIFQIIAFSSDQMTSESVNKLKEIHDDIEERENLYQVC